MKFPFKSFLAGVLVGCVLTLVGVGVALFLVGKAASSGPIQLAGAPELTETGPIETLRQGEEWTFYDLDGKAVSLGDKRGRPIFLNEWATWCGPCVAELPSIQALYDSLNAEGVFFALVSYQEPAKLKKFVQEKSLRMPVYTTKNTRPPKGYKSPGIPVTFILDRAGGIVAEHFGAANWDVLRVRRFLRRLLAP